MTVKKNKTLTSKFFTDARGEIYINKIKGREFDIIFTKAGAYRAGDYHSAKQYSVVLKGKVEIILRQNHKDVIKTCGPNELITIPSKIPHLYKSLTDSVIIQWLDGPYKPRYYVPYRKIINSSV